MSSGSVTLPQTGGITSINSDTSAAQSIVGGSGISVATAGGTTTITNTGAGSGTVTSVSVTTANGVSGTVANPTTTPAISLALGAITPTSVAATGAVSGSNLSGTNTGDQTITLTGDVSGSGTGSFDVQVDSLGAGLIASNTVADLLNGATDTNTPDTLVKRDPSGNFSGGVIAADSFQGDISGTNATFDNITANVQFTGSLTGDVTGNVTGNVTGDLTGNVTGDVTGSLFGNADTATTATNVDGIVVISHGGTNSTATLNNNRVMISSSGAIVEASAITASRALASDANGIPVASAVTATELGYLSGASSNIQTQLNAIGGSGLTSQSVSSNTTISNGAADLIVFTDTTAAAFTLTLPAPASNNLRRITVKDIAGTWGTNNLTIARNGSEKIETIAASYIASTNFGAVVLISNGTDWFII